MTSSCIYPKTPILKIKPIAPAEHLEERCKRLPADIARHVLSYQHPSSRLASYTAWNMLYETLQNAGWSHFSFYFSKNGKPYLAKPGLWFSLSHCDSWAGILIDTLPCGLDLQEWIKPEQNRVQRICTEEEKRLLANSSNPERDFTLLWTKKEARAKCLDLDLMDAAKKTDQDDYAHILYPKFVCCTLRQRNQGGR